MKTERMNIRRVSLWHFIIAAFAVVIPISNVAAQGICVPDTVTVNANSIAGKVVHIFDDGEGPVTSASVTIMKGHNNTPVLATQGVGTDGSFKFDHIKPGKYRLKVSDPHLLEFYLDLIIKRPNTTNDQKEIVVILGTDLTKPCGGSSAQFRAKKDADPTR